MIPLLYFLLAQTITVRPSLVLERIPEETGLYLEYPTDLTVCEQGNIYVLDAAANYVFVWDVTGHYIGTIGSPGKGPGELSFSQRSARGAYVRIIDNRVCVYDGNRWLLHIFDMAGHYLETRNFQGHGGRARFFDVTRENDLILLQQNYLKSTPVSELKIYNQGHQPIASLFRYEDRYFSPKMKGGKRVGWKINAFHPEPAIAYDSINDEVIIGRNESPELEIFSTNGRYKRTVRFTLNRREVTREDIAEYYQLPWLQNNHGHDVAFPEKMPYYQYVMPLGSRGYLVYSVSPFYRRAEGLLVDRRGHRLGRLALNCGESGGLAGSRGRIFVLRTDEMGEYTIEEAELWIGSVMAVGGD